MIILALELENIKSYEKTRIEFTEGVNAIVGHNGAGKSTIVEAIGYTLFNSLGYSQSEFVRSGAKSGTITVTFISAADERPYEVTRRIGSSTQIFVTDPELQTRICEGRADVDRFLYEHLRLEPGTDLRALFGDAVGVPQGTLTAAFLLADTPRRGIFDRLLQLADYRTASDKLLEPLRLLREGRATLENEIAGATARLERLEPLRREVAQDQATLARLAKIRSKLEQELEGVSRQRKAAEEAQAQAQAAQHALQQAEQRVQTLGHQAETAKAALSDAENAQTIVSENMPGYEAYIAAQETQKVIEEKTEARRRLAEELAQIDKQIALQQAAVARAEEELATIEVAEKTVAELSALVERQDALEEELSRAQKEAARLEDAQKQARQYENAIGRMQNRKEELGKALAETTELETKRKTANTELDDMRTEIDTRRTELARFKTQADAIKEQSEVLNRETAICPVCEKPLSEEQRTSLLDRNSREIERLRQVYVEVQKSMKSQELGVEGLRKTVEELENALRRAPRAAELATLAEELENTHRLYKDAQTTVEALRGADESIARLRKQLTELGNPRQQHAVAGAQAAQRPAVEGRLQNAQSQLQATNQAAIDLGRKLEAYVGLDQEQVAIRELLRANTDAYHAVLAHRNLAQNVDARRTTLETIGQELTAAEATLADCRQAAETAAAKFDAQVYEQLRKQEQELQTQLGVQESEARFTRERLARQEAEVAELETLAQELAAMQTRHQAFAQQERVLDKIRALLRQAQPYIAKALVRSISESAEQIFGDIMQDYSRRLQWGEDYGIVLRVDEHERQFAQLSGGEQMSAALSVRLALLREMSSIAVAFFDEPTANLDETRRESLARQILQIRGFRQLFVISHDDTFEQATQNVIRVERINGVSRVYTS